MQEPMTVPQQEELADAALEPPLHLVLLNDDDHTYEYVIEMLGSIFGYRREKAFAIACVVDSAGRATVETGGREEVTRHQEQIHTYGPDPRVTRCRGSMSAIVEPAA